MAKKPSTRESIQAEAVRQERRRRRGDHRGVAAADDADLDREEIISLVCKYFCRGHPVAQILKILKERHGIELNREQPYRMLSLAADWGWLKYEAPLALDLADRLKNSYSGLDDVEVVHTAANDDVARYGAREIISLLQHYKEGTQKRDTVHLGFAGGPMMRKLARQLADMLCEPRQGLPRTLVLHALVAGVDPHDPTTDPNAFFTYFVRHPGLSLEIKFVGLHAPPLVSNSDFAGLKRTAGIKEAFADRNDIDIFITSGADWDDEHSMFRTCMQRSKRAVKQLEEAGCVGDLLWRPIAAHHPVDVETDVRALTLVELADLHRFIAKRKDVVLVLGACGGCDRPKGRLLKAVLEQENQLVTHLVADTRTVGQAVDL